HRLHIGSDYIAHGVRQFPLDEIQRMSRGTGQIRRDLRGGKAILEEVAKMIQRVAPSISLVSDPVLQNTEGSAAVVPLMQLKAAGQLGNMFEGSFFGEKVTDLQIGIHAVLPTAKHFKDETVAVDDRCIALFPLWRSGFQQRVGVAPEMAKEFRW